MPNITVAGHQWKLLDPFDMQFRGDMRSEFPHDKTEAMYLWLARAVPDPVGGHLTVAEDARDRVLYVGTSTNVENRLHKYAAFKPYNQEEPVTNAIFDRIIAPQLGAEAVKTITVERLRPSVTRAWVRINVVFAWLHWTPELEKSVGMTRGKWENQLRRELDPWFNPYRSAARGEESLTYYENGDTRMRRFAINAGALTRPEYRSLG